MNESNHYPGNPARTVHRKGESRHAFPLGLGYGFNVAEVVALRDRARATSVSRCGENSGSRFLRPAAWQSLHHVSRSQGKAASVQDDVAPSAGVDLSHEFVGSFAGQKMEQLQIEEAACFVNCKHGGTCPRGDAEFDSVVGARVRPGSTRRRDVEVPSS